MKDLLKNIHPVDDSILDNYISNQDILLLLIFFNLRYFIPAIFGFIFNTSGLYNKKRIYKKR